MKKKVKKKAVKKAVKKSAPKKKVVAKKSAPLKKKVAPVKKTKIVTPKLEKKSPDTINHAVIDIGTNTLILLIATQTGPNKIKVLEDRATITRLGQGLTENHFFDHKAVRRNMDVLKQYKDICTQYGVKKIIAVGTAACRIAANAEVFVDSVKKETGIQLEVISGDAEATYTFEPAWRDFGKPQNKKLIVVDIGGGSTEIITGPQDFKTGQPQTVISLPFGSVRLTEQFIRHDPIEEDEFQSLVLGIRNGIRDELDDFYPADFDPSQYSMVASAGTATTLAAVDQQLTVYNPNRVHGSVLKKARLEELVNRMVRMTIAERRRLAGMEPLRADVILAGAILLLEILNFYKQDEVIISDRGLRYGVYYHRFLKI